MRASTPDLTRRMTPDREWLPMNNIPTWQGIASVVSCGLGFLGLVTVTMSLLERHDTPRPVRRVALGFALPTISVAILVFLALAPNVSRVSILSSVTSYFGVLLLIAGGILLASKRDPRPVRMLGALLLVPGVGLLVAGSVVIGGILPCMWER